MTVLQVDPRTNNNWLTGL